MIPHVLLVDDSALMIDALRLLLEETGHRVSAAFTVREAVSIASTERPDIIFLDLTLGREDGLSVLTELGRTGSLPRVAVAITGHDTPDARERCLRGGCTDVLTKPIRTMELPGQIREWLSRDNREALSSDSAS